MIAHSGVQTHTRQHRFFGRQTNPVSPEQPLSKLLESTQFDPMNWSAFDPRTVRYSLSESVAELPDGRARWKTGAFWQAFIYFSFALNGFQFFARHLRSNGRGDRRNADGVCSELAIRFARTKTKFYPNWVDLEFVLVSSSRIVANRRGIQLNSKCRLNGLSRSKLLEQSSESGSKPSDFELGTLFYTDQVRWITVPLSWFANRSRMSLNQATLNHSYTIHTIKKKKMRILETKSKKIHFSNEKSKTKWRTIDNRSR